MQPLFSAAGERDLAAAMKRHPLLAFDFDGTLAPIVRTPAMARMPAAIGAALARLAALRPVAIVTGRSVADVVPRLGFVPHYLIGNHGAEDRDVLAAEPASAPLRSTRETLQAHAAALRGAGVEVEDKRYSIALHYRRAPDRRAARAEIDALLQTLPGGLAIFPGKCVVNIAAAQSPDKGDALLALVARSGAGTAVFVGDDINDEAAFEKAREGWLTIRVGTDFPASKARYFLAGHGEVEALMQQMLQHLKPV
jgi:trehalose 6-phosphate phosphatase